MEIDKHNLMVNDYIKKEINEILGQDGPNLEKSLIQVRNYKERKKKKLNELREELNELIDNPKSFKDVNEELFDVIDIAVENWDIFIEGNGISFILPYPETVNEFRLTIDTIKNYLRISEKIILYGNYKKAVQKGINTCLN